MPVLLPPILRVGRPRITPARATGMRERAPAQPASPGVAERAPDTLRMGDGALVEPIVLVVDDDRLMTDLLPERLAIAARAGTRIITAQTPAEARALIAERKPDVVLCDFNLRAAETGLDVLRHAAVASPASVRILISGHTAHEIGPALWAAPVHAFVEKTMRLDDMLPPIFDAILAANGVDLRHRAR